MKKLWLLILLVLGVCLIEVPMNENQRISEVLAGPVQLPSAHSTGGPGSEPVPLWPPSHKPPGDFQGTPGDTVPRKRPFDAAKARKDAQDLAALASRIPQEVDQLSKSILPKDLDQQLRQIQKLAKRLRGQISP